MRKFLLPMLMILLGIAEIVIAFTGVKLPLPIAIILGVIFIGSGTKVLLNAGKA